MVTVLHRTLSAIALLSMTQLAVSDSAQWVEENCGSCHALERLAYEGSGVEARAQRNGPPLFYAGAKFRKEWLVSWLQSPRRIRPAGDYPPRHVETVGGEDQVREDSLRAHQPLDARQAEEVADYLMTLNGVDESTVRAEYEPGSTAWRLAQMNFAKFNNCIACHRDEPAYGGVSGPELYTAWERLQPGFIASYIVDPVAWDPYTSMPAQDLNASAVQKLVDYLRMLAEEE
jgi:mono/diheme cytochrome c family protein